MGLAGGVCRGGGGEGRRGDLGCAGCVLGEGEEDWVRMCRRGGQGVGDLGERERWERIKLNGRKREMQLPH